MAGLASIGVKVHYAAGVTVPSTAAEIKKALELPNCQACPSLGGDVDQIDVTCLADSVKKYIPGLKDYGSLDFTFLMDNQENTSSYTIMKSKEGQTIYFAIELPAKTGKTFGGGFWFSAIPTVKMNEIGVGEALTWTLSLSLQSDVEYVAAA